MSINYSLPQDETIDFLTDETIEIQKTKDPFDPAPLCALFKDFRSKIEEMESEAENHQVNSDQSSSRAVEMSAQAKQLCNAISKKQKIVTNPYHTVKATIDRECKVLKDNLTKIQATLEKKNRPYLTLKEYERREAEKQANQERENLQEQLKKEAWENGNSPPPIVVSPAIPSETKTVTESGSATLKTEWLWDIEDMRKLPEQCINERMEYIIKAVSPWINAQIKAGIRNISGVNVYEATKIQTRVRR